MEQKERCVCRRKHREAPEERGMMNRLNRIDPGNQGDGGE